MTTQEQETLPKTHAPWQARLAGLTLGTPRRHGSLTAYPLLGDTQGTNTYCLLEEALRAGTLTVEETEMGGTVPALRLTNTGPDRVLLLDGEELVGAKQNRIVNTSVLVDARTTLSLPVTCVEAGRWRQDTARFEAGGSHYNARGRQKKVAEVSASLARSGRADADQNRVWSDIEGKLSRMAVAAPTNALHDVTRTYAGDLEAYQNALGTPEPGQVGVLFALGRDLVGLDCFDQSKTLAALLPKLVASYALDALEERTADAAPPGSVAADWLKALAEAEAARHAAVGLGEDLRLSGPRVAGAALEFGGAALHLSAFAASAASSGTLPRTRIARPSVRR